MEIINKLKDYNKYVVGAWISARVSHKETIILLYKMPGISESEICIFDTFEDFINSKPLDILKMAGFVRVVDKM